MCLPVTVKPLKSQSHWQNVHVPTVDCVKRCVTKGAVIGQMIFEYKKEMLIYSTLSVEHAAPGIFTHSSLSTSWFFLAIYGKGLLKIFLFSFFIFYFWVSWKKWNQTNIHGVIYAMISTLLLFIMWIWSAQCVLKECICF